MKQEEQAVTAAANTETAVAPAEASPVVVAGKMEIKVTTMSDMADAVAKGKELGDINKLKVGTINLKTEYKSFDKPGEVIRRVFIGFTLRQSVDPVTGEDKGLQPAVQLYDPETETINVCMQAVICGVIYETGYPKGAALQITYKGDQKNKKGLKYQDFDIRALVPGE